MSAAWPTPRPGILAIDPYVPGRSKTASGTTLHKLSSNESPFGPSPHALAAYRDAASDLDRYPDGSALLLREAIAGRHGLDPDRIVCGDGSFEILNLIAQAYLQPGDEAIHSAHGFLLYRIATLSAGGTPIVAPETELTADVDAILAAITARTKVVFLTNPNNPTGTYLPASEIARLHENLPETVLLVLDAAYAEYVRAPDFDSGLALAIDAANVVLTRTFSKVYGLAALRLGWCTGPAEVVDTLNRIRGPFNVSAPAIAAGVAAMADIAHIDRTVDHNEFWRPKVTAALAESGLSVTPSVANFVLIHFPDDAARTAADADAFLLRSGIVLRRMDAYGLPNALRMTIGNADANTDTIRALGAFMEGAE